MFKKIKWFLFYRKTIRKNRILLYQKNGLKIDWVNRMYKTFTLSDDDIEQIKIYGNSYVKTIIEKEQVKIENTLIELGLGELVALIELEQLNEKQIGMAFRFKFFDTAKISSILLWFLITLIITLGAFLINYEIKSIYYGLITTLCIYVISRFFRIKRIDK